MTIVTNLRCVLGIGMNRSQYHRCCPSNPLHPQLAFRLSGRALADVLPVTLRHFPLLFYSIACVPYIVLTGREPPNSNRSDFNIP